jgi:hypothetical protein
MCMFYSSLRQLCTRKQCHVFSVAWSASARSTRSCSLRASTDCISNKSYNTGHKPTVKNVVIASLLMFVALLSCNVRFQLDLFLLHWTLSIRIKETNLKGLAKRCYRTRLEMCVRGLFVFDACHITKNNCGLLRAG